MNEVEKMYENAGIKSEWRYIVHQFCHFYEADKKDILRNKYLFKERKTARIKKTEKKYPPFTAEKQLGLIKWMIKTNHRYFIQDIIADDFSETLAGVFNLYWQDLTEEERTQIRGILE